MRAVWIAGCVVVTLVAIPARAEPRPYRGPHPIDLEGRWHDESAVHVHDDLPVGLDPFASIDGVLVFLADPAGYGWRGERWAFRGAHPLPARIGGTCGIEGEHRHPFAPEGEFRRDASGVYRFAGALRGGEPTYVPGRTTAPEGTSSVVTEAPPPVPIGIPFCSPDVPPGFACVSPVGGGVEVVEPGRRPARTSPPPARPLPDRAQGRRHSAGPMRHASPPPVRRRPQPPPPLPWPI